MDEISPGEFGEGARDASIDQIQSKEYDFPYHYIPNPDGFPYFSRYWSFSPSYIAAIRLVKNWLAGIRPASGHLHMDYGCGDGGLVNALRGDPKLGHVEFFGVDFDEKAISWAQMLSGDASRFESIDIAELPKRRYDSGTLIEVFEHIPPDEAGAFVRNISRSLKPSAPLFVTVPSTEVPLNKKHYRHFNFEDLKNCFVDSFDVEKCFAFERRTKLLNYSSRALRNRYWHCEIRALSEYNIRKYAEEHFSLSGCGRVGLVLRNK